MSTKRPPALSRLTPAAWQTALAVTAAWAAAAGLAVAATGPRDGLAFAAATALALGATLALTAWTEHRRWAAPARRLAEQVTSQSLDPGRDPRFDAPPGFRELSRALERLSDAHRQAARAVASGVLSRPFTPPGDSGTTGPNPAMTRSGLFDPPSDVFTTAEAVDPTQSSEFSTTDMINRLEPRGFRWIESSPAEQQFLGWDLGVLRGKSFLEIVHPDDAARVNESLRAALVKGDVHGLVCRIRTSRGKSKAVEMHVGARYGPDMTVSHLRCHVADVTAKLRAERALRQQARELTLLNDQLRLTNRALEELKERYLDLYQNAPVMYFSLDAKGVFLDCNDTMLRALGYRRGALLGRPYAKVLHESLRPLFARRFAEFLRTGSIEIQSRWVKADGGEIVVWVKGTAVRGTDGQVLHSRSVAQDMTARSRLEAELKEKNDRLARTIDELSRRNREMDEFTYVVSHDLQEPLRTLTAFSDFLLRDYGERLDPEGREFVRYIVAASRRMRALIHDLLTLSRAGKVTGEFGTVNLEELVAQTRADLAELIRSRRAEVCVVGPLPPVWGDRDRIGQLLTNLVTNGLKYNDKADPRVEIGALEGGRDRDFRVTLFVRDNGIGIEPQFHTKVFQLFRRLHTPEEVEGTGAGLAICSKIVQAHGGRIWLESEPNRGATFFVTLPKAPLPVSPEGAPVPSQRPD
jgi:PAS domain S-box-containing protein